MVTLSLDSFSGAKSFTEIDSAMTDNRDTFVSPFSTGGGGFVFEDEVVAFYLSCLLAAVEPFGGDGPDDGKVVEVACQQANHGWHPDDVLLTLGDGTGARRCAISIKSYPALKRTGFTEKARRDSDGKPKESLLEQAWQLYLGMCPVDPPFDPERDLIGLVTSEIAAIVREDWKGILNTVCLQDPTTVWESGFNKRQQRLFDSFACPEHLDHARTKDRAATARFLRCLRVMDFQQHRLQALMYCRELVLSGTAEDANKLWEALCHIAGVYRSSAAQSDLRVLMERLRGEHLLKPYPDHRRDWERLERIASTLLGEIDDTIGGIRLPREKEQNDIEDLLGQPDTCAVVLLGESGCGKTVVAKRWAESVSGDLVVWWDSHTFDATGPTAFDQALDLKHPIEDVLQTVPEEQAYLVIDSIDRIPRGAAWDNLARLLRSLRLDESETPWRVVATCEAEAWERVEGNLANAQGSPNNWRALTIDSPTRDALKPITESLPGLASVFAKKHLQSLVFRPKVIALLVANLRRGYPPDVRNWVGESDVIKWLWENEIEQSNLARSQVARKLATCLADLHRSAVSVDEFDASETQVLTGLQQHGICRFRNEQVSFAHDLYGDWARLRVLISQQRLAEFLEMRIDSPLWQRALRLYGLHLLEQNPDTTMWQDALQSFAQSSQEPSPGEAAILEALVFAAGEGHYIEHVWPILIENDGRLLRLFLQRFCHVATEPDDRLISLVLQDKPQWQTQARAQLRSPFGRSWASVLPVLSEKREDVLRLAPAEFADLAQIWLRVAVDELPFRSQVAEMAINGAERFAAENDQAYANSGWRASPPARIYSAAMMAATELPDRVAEFALERARRRGRRGTEEELEVFHEPFTDIKLPLPDLWPDGPSRRVDELFRKVCLDNSGLTHLMRTRPEVAREVMLALLISPPDPDSPFVPRLGDLPFEMMPGWSPPFYDQGPFHVFLKVCPESGIETILRLVNFATERQAELGLGRNEDVGPFRVTIPKWGDWQGDARVFYWYSGEMGDSVVACALMALEKWLYDLLDEEKPIEPWLSQIVAQSRSVAFAGLLAAVGSRQPGLLKTAFRALLGVPEFHIWELHHDPRLHPTLMLEPMMSAVIGEERFNRIKEWHMMPHRQIGLDWWGQHLFINEPELEAFFEQVRQTWIEHRERNGNGEPLGDSLDWLIAKYDRQNWVVKDHPEHGPLAYFTPPPALKAEVDAIEPVLAQQQLFLELPLLCNQYLEKGEALDDESAEQLWLQVKQLAEGDQSVQGAGLELADSLCGAAAVLLLLSRDWLTKRPERENWCIEQVVRTSLRPPKRRFDTAETFVKFSSEAFCARVLPTLWAENVDEPKLRRSVAYLALSPHWLTATYLTVNAAKLRMQLGDEFNRLRHLVMLSARARYQEIQVEREQHYRQYSHTRGGIISRIKGRLKALRHFNIDRWIRQRVRLFVERKLDADCPTLMALAAWQQHRGRSDERRRRRRDPGIHMMFAHAAYAWLPSLEEATSPAERGECISLWKDVLDLTVARLAPGVDDANDDKEIEGIPDDWDRWALRAIAYVVLKMHPQEVPEQLWRPLLVLGSPALHWIKEFIEWFLNVGLSGTVSRDAFIKQWRTMIDFAYTCRTWQSDRGRSKWDLEEMWYRLMGLGLVFDSWTADHASLVGRMSDLYERWAGDHLSALGSREAFVRFLLKPAAEHVVMDALVWLANEPMPSRADSRTRRHDDEVAGLIAQCWSQRREEIVQQPEIMTAIQTLLRSLGQHRVALQLLDEIASSQSPHSTD